MQSLCLYSPWIFIVIVEIFFIMILYLIISRGKIKFIIWESVVEETIKGSENYQFYGQI